MGHFAPGLFGLIFFLVYAVIVLGGIALAISVVWAVWRMTRAHEKIEQHVADIARMMAARTGGENR